jgi:hypothetical protein
MKEQKDEDIKDGTVVQDNSTQGGPYKLRAAIPDFESESESGPLSPRPIPRPNLTQCERIKPSAGKPCNTIFSHPYDLTRHEDTIHNACKQKVHCPLCIEEKSFSRNVPSIAIHASSTQTTSTCPRAVADMNKHGFACA